MTSNDAFICDAIRTPFGRYGGALSSVRADDLGAIPLKALMARNPKVDWAAVTTCCSAAPTRPARTTATWHACRRCSQDLPMEVPGATINRLCGSGLDAVGTAARAIKSGEAALMIAGGVESMSRAPFVMPKAESAFSRSNAVHDTTIGWRFVNALMKAQYGVDSMPETAENVATDYRIEREAQDRMALASQQKAVAAQRAGHLAREITPVTIPQKKGEAVVVDQDEHPRETSLEALAKLKGVVRPDGTVTAGNASGVNDGACALLLANEAAAARYGLDAARACGRDGDRRGRTAGHGHRPRAGHDQGARAGGPAAGPARRDRAERSVRRPGPGGAAPARPGGRRPARERVGRGDRARPSARRERRTARDHGREPVARDRRTLCARDDVHRRRTGDRRRAGAGLSRRRGRVRVRIAWHAR